MQRIAAAAEIVGSLAGTLTTLSFLPQVYKVLHDRETAGISITMYAAFMLGVVLWCIYGAMIGSLSAMIANFVTLVLAGIVLAMKIHLDRCR